MIKVFKIAVILIMCALTFGCTPKTAYADNSIILNSVDVIKRTQDKLLVFNNTIKAELSTQEAELMQLKTIAEYDTSNKDALNKYSAKYQEYQKLLEEKQNALSQKEQELFNPVYSQITNLIQVYAESNGYDLVLGATTSGNILYANDELDITDELIEFINGEI